jgi:hypothetical protein
VSTVPIQAAAAPEGPFAQPPGSLDTSDTSATANTVDEAPADDAGASTSALVVELPRLLYAVQARTRRDAWGSEAAADDELRSLLRRRNAVLQELWGRGLDLPDEHVGPQRRVQHDRSASVPASPRREPAAPVEPTTPIERTTPVELAVKVGQLEQGLLTRTVIGQAQGILIERHQVTPPGCVPPVGPSKPNQQPQTARHRRRPGAHRNAGGPPLTGSTTTRGRLLARCGGGGTRAFYEADHAPAARFGHRGASPACPRPPP